MSNLSTKKNNLEISIIPLSNGFIEKTFDLFRNFSETINIDEFRAIYYSNNSRNGKKKLLKTNINIALYNKMYVHGYYIYHVSMCDFYNIDQIVIPGPLGRQTILKKFIEYFIKDAIEKNSKAIFINNINKDSWENIFFREIGARNIGEGKIKIRL
jgi:hypothetical protein